MQNAADVVLPGLGKVLLFSALLGLVTISSLNFYGASLTLLSVADTVKPLVCTVGKRLASLLVAFAASVFIAVSSSGNFVNRFQDLLDLLLYLFTPWTAINLVDFYVVRKGHYSIREIFNPLGMYGRWNWRGLTAYVIGFLAMIPFFSTGMYTRADRHCPRRRRRCHAGRPAGRSGRLSARLPLDRPRARPAARRRGGCRSRSRRPRGRAAA